MDGTVLLKAEIVPPEKGYPAGVAEEDCKLSHTRPVWRLENGQAIIVADEVYGGPKSQFGNLARQGVTARHSVARGVAQ